MYRLKHDRVHKNLKFFKKLSNQRMILPGPSKRTQQFPQIQPVISGRAKLSLTTPDLVL